LLIKLRFEPEEISGQNSKLNKSRSMVGPHLYSDIIFQR